MFTLTMFAAVAIFPYIPTVSFLLGYFANHKEKHVLAGILFLLSLITSLGFILPIVGHQGFSELEKYMIYFIIGASLFGITKATRLDMQGRLIDANHTLSGTTILVCVVSFIFMTIADKNYKVAIKDYMLSINPTMELKKDK